MWSDDKLNYDNIVETKENQISTKQFVSESLNKYIDETYINQKKNVSVRKWRVKIV